MENLTLEEAMAKLDEGLKSFDWYIATGTNGTDIYLYVTKPSKVNQMKNTWHGHPLIIKKMGKPKPE